MTIRRFIPALAVLFGTCVSSAGAATDPCALVTRAEASKALGVAALAGKEAGGTSGRTCRYYSPDHLENVFVQLMSTSTVNEMESHLHLKQVAGVPTPAYWLAGSIFMTKGPSAAQVTVYRSAQSMATMDPAVVTLAKLVAGRL